jgi:hypothetical protein
MSLTILYHNPRRPDEPMMTLIPGQPSAAATVDRLEARGFVVDKIQVRPARGSAIKLMVAPSPRRRPQNRK